MHTLRINLLFLELYGTLQELKRLCNIPSTSNAQSYVQRNKILEGKETKEKDMGKRKKQTKTQR